MKALQFRNRKKSVPTEHPDGGLFFLFPLDPEKAGEYQDFAEEVGRKGDTQSKQYKELVAYVAENIVDRIEKVVDIETGEPVEVDDEIKAQILAQISDREVERQVPVLDPAADFRPKIEDGKVVTEAKMLPVNEPYFLWAMLEATKLLKAKEAAIKN